MRFIIAALLLCLAGSVQAKPSQIADEFRGDRWERIAQAGTSAADINRVMRCPAPLLRDCRSSRKAKKHPRHERAKVAARPVTVIVPLPRVRTRGAAIEQVEGDSEQEAAYRVIADLLAGGKVYVRPQPRKRMNIFEGFAREIERALPRRGVSLAGVVKPLALKAQQIMAACPGSRVISARVGRERSVVRGSGRPSLHREGRAVDMAGNPACIARELRKWPGGVSNDYAAVRHYHFSYAPGGREWGVRFAHWKPGKRRTRYARHHRRQHTHYARAS
jgi:hypothetical protein